MGAVITHINVSERKLIEDHARQMAFHDALTELPNRRLFTDRLIQSMAASTRSGSYGALMFLDLDNFKPLNDLHGHEAGDLLLIEAAARLKAGLREMDTAARFGGDEFVVLINALDTDKSESTAQAALIAEKIRASLAEPYLLTLVAEGKKEQKLQHRCTVSIGVALFVDHHASIEEILKWADAAMYQAKAAGRDTIRYSAAASSA
jgi:diguanylate cyclase (GGDEF)-like protein